MHKFDVGPAPLKCANCKKDIVIRLSELEKGNIIKCPHCNFQYQVDNDYYKQVQDSLRDLQKTISNIQKEIDKAFK